jgi:hypothetical protein
MNEPNHDEDDKRARETRTRKHVTEFRQLLVAVEEASGPSAGSQRMIDRGRSKKNTGLG